MVLAGTSPAMPVMLRHRESFCTRVRFMLMSCKQDICIGFSTALPRVPLLLALQLLLERPCTFQSISMRPLLALLQLASQQQTTEEDKWK